MDENLPRLGRRWFLGGAGAAITLPLLNVSMDVRKAAAATGDKRLFLFHIPAGINVTAWRPSGSGTSFTFGATQKPVEDAGLKDKSIIVTGVSGIGGPRGHTCGISGVLTGVQCRENSSNNAISMDQVAAQAFADSTRFSSIELGTSHNRENPNGEAGYSTVIKDNLSWANSTTPMEKETDPSRAFNRIFAGVTPTEATGQTPAPATGEESPALQAKDAIRASVLDYAREQTEALKPRLGTADQAKLDQYLTSVRELESTIQTTPTNGDSSDGGGTIAAGSCDPGSDPGTPNDIEVHVKVQLDIIALAFQCGLTRVASFAYEHTTTERSHTHLGVTPGWHSNVTHHANNQTALANYATVNTWLVGQYVYLAQKLDAIDDGDGRSILDNSVGMLFSELSDGDSHNNNDLPCLLLGSAGGALNTGTLVAGGGNFGGSPIEGVHLALLQALGVGATSFGRANSPIAGLLA